MFSGLPTASLRLSDLFSRPFLFAVPSYQRPYSWTVKEAGQLLEDVMKAAGFGDEGDAETDYFLGPIILIDPNGGKLPKNPKDEALRTFEIVDGQQRLVTLTILLAVLRDLEDDIEGPGASKLNALISVDATQRGAMVPRFRVSLRGREQDFVQTHVQQPGSCALMPDDDSLTVGEASILDVRENYGAELSALSAAERTRLQRYICDDCHFVVILALDIDRAYRLFTVFNERGKPLQRNDILKADVLRSVPADRSAAAAETWDRVSVMLGPAFEDFFSHIRMIYDRGRDQVISGVRHVVRDAGGAESFIHRVLEPLAKSYNSILSASDPKVALDPDVRRYLIHLNRLNGSDWVPAALTVLSHYQNKPRQAAAYFKEIDRLAYLLRLLTLGAGRRAKRFSNVVDAIRAGQKLVPGSGPFEVTKEELKSIAYHLRSLYRRNPQICKPLLMRLNDELSGAPVLINPADYSVEHVLPQRPGASSEWRRMFASHEERDSCTDSLGNLVLVTHRQNDKARNQDFARKREVYQAREQGFEPLAITRDVIDARSWLADEIKTREMRLINLIYGIWDIDLDPLHLQQGDRETGKTGTRRRHG